MVAWEMQVKMTMGHHFTLAGKDTIITEQKITNVGENVEKPEVSPIAGEGGVVWLLWVTLR